MAQLSLFLVLFISCFAIIDAQEPQNEVGTDGFVTVTETEQENESSASGELEKRGDTTMTNVGYIMQGYHALEGNPLDPNRFDPGFKAKIFKATYKKNRRTDDQRYKIPDSVDILGKKSCYTSFSSETVMTESDYQRSLLAKASVSASGNIKIVKASFSASVEYSRMSKTLKSNTKSVIRSEATCTVYEGRIQTGTPPEFTGNFVANVRTLQKKKNYGSFLDKFGTHFVEAMDMGARFTKLQEISKERLEKLKKQGIDVKLAASVSAAGIGSVGTGRELKVSEEQTKKYEKAVESTTTVTIGSKVPADKSQDTWIAKAIENPLPTYYKLRHIVEVFEPAFFRDHKDIDYTKLKKELTNYLQGYCKSLKSSRLPDVECEGPPKGCAGGSQCSVNAICNDNPNSGDKEQKYDCKCKAGFEGDGRICLKSPKWTLGGEIQHEEEDRGTWGNWGGMENCKDGIFASGFSIKAQKKGRGVFYDDEGASAVCINCDNTNVCSKKFHKGTWSNPLNCPKNSYLSGWKQNVEERQGGKDDTALNNVEYKCRDIETWEETGVIMEPFKEWGKWSLYTECPKGSFICGINTRVEDSNGDDTALNDIRHQCCKPLLKKKAKNKKKHHSETE